MRILITGGSGLIGKSLSSYFQDKGYRLFWLTRKGEGDSQIHWDPEKGILEPAALEGFSAIIHLAGENIASQRWTVEQKRKIRESRLNGTSLLVNAIQKLKSPPSTFISASATGYYGSRGEEILTEESQKGKGFLADLCQEWEAATEPLRGKGIRVIHTRFGLVLSREGGALQKMLLPFQLGLGGPVGNGRQYWSWISLPDLVSAIDFLMEHHDLSGPFNLVSPQPVTNREFAKILGESIRRPAFLSLPAAAAKIVLGEMAEALLLCSARVLPQKLMQNRFEFQHRTLREAFASMITPRVAPGHVAVPSHPASPQRDRDKQFHKTDIGPRG